MEQLEAVPVALILGGGMALGAYQAGVLAGLEASGRIHVAAVAGTAIGAVNGAVLAGNPAGQRAQRLREFWEHVTTDLAPAWFEGGGGTGALRRARNIANVLGTYVGGARGLYQPRNFLRRGDTGPGLYDTSQAAETLARFVDFDALNRSGVRFCALAMDVETARLVSFDTEAGDRIEPVHLLAACALMPSFAPLRVGERLLADAAPCANAPLEVFLSSARVGQVPPLCILIDLFAPDAAPPLTLEAAAARAVELRHAAQTALRLEALERERSLEAALALPGAEPPDGAARSAAGTELIQLCYRPPPHDAGAERVHDFSRATLAERWRRGQEDAEAVVSKTLELVPSAGAEAGLHLHRVGAWTQPLR